ncbi:MAG: copper homeostasis protein CutC [Hyphomicrobiales bacterium]|nr:MAG: copper homeostasis protein CutC [Hyphomicrobiales bacterium]
MILEVCVADPQSLAAAIAGGADRLELCSALELGGLTPLPGLLALAAEASVPVYAMVRPRAGDFVFDAADTDTMLRDIDAIRAAGLAGVVIGASLADGRLDTRLLERLRSHADGLGATLHRAIDLVPDVAEATEAAIAVGVERILSSGGAESALDGLDRLAVMHRVARGRVAIMAGAGIRPGNAAEIIASGAVDELHSSCSGEPIAASPAAVRLGFATGPRMETDAGIVRALKAEMASRDPA